MGNSLTLTDVLSKDFIHVKFFTADFFQSKKVSLLLCKKIENSDDMFNAQSIGYKKKDKLPKLIETLDKQKKRFKSI